MHDFNGGLFQIYRYTGYTGHGLEPWQLDLLLYLHEIARVPENSAQLHFFVFN